MYLNVFICLDESNTVSYNDFMRVYHTWSSDTVAFLARGILSRVTFTTIAVRTNNAFELSTKLYEHFIFSFMY